MSEGSSSNSRSDINEIISNIVNHPSFRSTLNQILDVRSGATNVSNNHSTPSGVPTEELVDTASRPSQRYNSPAQEFSSIFQRGGSSSGVPYQRGRNHARGYPYPRSRPASQVRGGRSALSTSRTQTARASSASTSRASSIFRTKEVILLPGKNDSEVCRGNRKVLLMNSGFIRSELELDRRWTAQQVVEHFEKCFEEKLATIPKTPAVPR